MPVCQADPTNMIHRYAMEFPRRKMVPTKYFWEFRSKNCELYVLSLLSSLRLFNAIKVCLVMKVVREMHGKATRKK